MQVAKYAQGLVFGDGSVFGATFFEDDPMPGIVSEVAGGEATIFSAEADKAEVISASIPDAIAIEAT